MEAVDEQLSEPSSVRMGEGSDQKLSSSLLLQPPSVNEGAAAACGGVRPQETAREGAPAAITAAHEKGKGGSLKGAKKLASKRKSRAAKKPPIKVLSADKSTFRDIVLQLTGVPPSTPAHHHHQYPRPHLASSYSFPPYSLNAGHLFGTPRPSLSNSPNAPSPLYPSHALPHNLTSPLTNPAHALLDSLSQDAMISQLDSLSQDACMMLHSEINLSKNLAFLEGLMRSLSHIMDGIGCGSSNCLLGQFNVHDNNYDEASNNNSNNNNNNDDGGFGGLVDLNPRIENQENQTPESINTHGGGELSPTKLLDMQHAHNTWQAQELESFLLSENDKLDDSLVSKLLHNELSGGSNHSTLTPSMELPYTCS